MIETRHAAKLAGLDRATFTQRVKGHGLKPAGRVRRRHPGHPQHLWHKTAVAALLIYPELRSRGVAVQPARAVVRIIGSMTDEQVEARLADGIKYVVAAGPSVYPGLLPWSAVERMAAERQAELAALGYTLLPVDFASFFGLVAEGVDRIAQAEGSRRD